VQELIEIDGKAFDQPMPVSLSNLEARQINIEDSVQLLRDHMLGLDEAMQSVFTKLGMEVPNPQKETSVPNSQDERI
jgi:hypothetical protein